MIFFFVFKASFLSWIRLEGPYIIDEQRHEGDSSTVTDEIQTILDYRRSNIPRDGQKLQSSDGSDLPTHFHPIDFSIIGSSELGKPYS
jgi:hypothetical protein